MPYQQQHKYITSLDTKQSFSQIKVVLDQRKLVNFSDVPLVTKIQPRPYGIKCIKMTVMAKYILVSQSPTICVRVNEHLKLLENVLQRSREQC